MKKLILLLMAESFIKAQYFITSKYLNLLDEIMGVLTVHCTPNGLGGSENFTNGA